MEYDSEIKRLEDFVERLLKGYGELKAEINKLEQELQDQQVENEQLHRQMETMESERGDLGNRVSTLIDRIEAWESELETEEFDAEAATAAAAEDSSDDGSGELDEDDGGGGVQGNLFTASATSQ